MDDTRIKFNLDKQKPAKIFQKKEINEHNGQLPLINMEQNSGRNYFEERFRRETAFSNM